MKVPYAKVLCDGNEMKYLKEVIDSGWLTTASKAKELELKIKTMVGAKHAFAVNSCTSALHLALDAMGIKRGDKVLVPSLTFCATAEVICYLGAEPVLVDIDYQTRSMSADTIKTAIEKCPSAKAIILVHFAGQALNMEKIVPLCKKHNIRIIEDAAHALPAKDKEKMIGSIGDITCFSFYANKTMTSAEGGMVLTNDDNLAARIKQMRLHGIDRDVWDRFTSAGTGAKSAPAWMYDVVAPGYKYNMPDLNAAVGLAQLEKLYENRDGRERAVRFYDENLKDIKQINLPKLRVKYSDHAWHIYSIAIKSKTITRDQFIEKMTEAQIGTAVHYRPIHQLKYYKQKYKFNAKDYPETEKYWLGAVSLPLFASLKESELNYICKTIRTILNE